MPDRRRGRADPPRRVAYDVLRAVEERAAYANLLLPRLLDERGISGRDAALATELTYGTLRGLGTYDAVLGACCDRPLDRLDPPVRDVLRLGTHQLLGMRTGSHAAVSTSVDLAKDVAGPRTSGFVNAVLRRVATRDLGKWLSILAPGDLATRYSYPEWIVEATREVLGDGELEAALAAGNQRPRVVMAAVPGVADRAEVMPDGADPTRWSPYGFALRGGNPRELMGRAAVQDEASQLAALALTRVTVTGAETRWLDLCAGPGGKARMLHGVAAERGIRLAACDVHEHRARLVRDAVGEPAPAGGVVTADSRAPSFCPDVFDRVLVDVPCTGLGALRRRPEARWRKSPEDVAGLAGLQRDLLRSAITLTRPGGVIAYVTCSPVAAETSEVVLDVAGEQEILDAPAMLSEVPDLAASDPRFAQFWPHRHGTDAIFIALLRRRPLSERVTHRGGPRRAARWAWLSGWACACRSPPGSAR
jgi:16S rRNA (cytosine967-C5)-methyltransferase